jgi:hypothetical protein
MRSVLKNKRGTEMMKVVAWVLGVLVLVALVFILTKVPAITEKIVGIFDGIMLLFGQGSSADLQDTYLILEKPRKVVLDDGANRCFVEINNVKYALNFDKRARFEVYTDVYSMKLFRLPISLPEIALRFIYLDKWYWNDYDALFDSLEIEESFKDNEWNPNNFWFSVNESLPSNGVIVPRGDSSMSLEVGEDLALIFSGLRRVYDNKEFGAGLLSEFETEEKWLSIDTSLLDNSVNARQKEIKERLGEICR